MLVHRVSFFSPFQILQFFKPAPPSPQQIPPPTSSSKNLIIGPNIPAAPGDRFPHPFAQPILDQACENHQILGGDQELVANLFPRGVLGELTRRQDFPLVPDAGDGPQQQRADVARDGG